MPRPVRISSERIRTDLPPRKTVQDESEATVGMNAQLDMKLQLARQSPQAGRLEQAEAMIRRVSGFRVFRSP